jgi:hypothetical protein
MRNVVPQAALALIFGALAFAWSGAAEAKTGLAPVVVDGSLDPRLARDVERAILRDLRMRGADPPDPMKVLPLLALASPKEIPATPLCVAAGKKLGLDLLLLIRIRNLHAGTRLQTELRAVVVETGEERVFSGLTLLPYSEPSPRALVVSGARDLVAGALGEFGSPEEDLIEVERALLRNCDEAYAEYRASGVISKYSFADYMYLKADKRMRGGRMIAIVVPAILAAGTTTILLAGFKPWTWDDHDGEQCDPNCMATGFGELFLTIGFMAVTIVGYGATFATLALSLRAYSKGKRDLGLLRPLVPNPPKREKPEMELVAFAPWASPQGGGLALDLRF